MKAKLHKFLRMLPVAVALSSYDGVAIRKVLLVCGCHYVSMPWSHWASIKHDCILKKFAPLAVPVWMSNNYRVHQNAAWHGDGGKVCYLQIPY